MTSTRKEVSETHLQLARRVYADSPVKVIGDMEAGALVRYLAEEIAKVEREAFRRAAEIAEKHFDLRHNATARACGMSVAAAIRSEMEGK